MLRRMHAIIWWNRASIWRQFVPTSGLSLHLLLCSHPSQAAYASLASCQHSVLHFKLLFPDLPDPCAGPSLRPFSAVATTHFGSFLRNTPVSALPPPLHPPEITEVHQLHLSSDEKLVLISSLDLWSPSSILTLGSQFPNSSCPGQWEGAVSSRQAPPHLWSQAEVLAGPAGTLPTARAHRPVRVLSLTSSHPSAWLWCLPRGQGGGLSSDASYVTLPWFPKSPLLVRATPLRQRSL